MSKHEHSNLFNRYIWLVNTINEAGRISFRDISAKWERSRYNIDGGPLPRKTFQRHIEAIEELFDIDIECERSGLYRYYICNAEEISGTDMKSWLLNTLSVNSMLSESHHIKDRIIFEQIPSGQNFLKPIVEAMGENRTIILTYQSFNRSAPNTFEAEPWCVKVFKQRWYLLAKSEGYSTPRIYALDRIIDIDTTENRFNLPKGFIPDDFFSGSYGIIIGDSSKKPEPVVIRVSEDQQKYIRTLPLHFTQKEIATEEEYSDFQVTLRPTFDFAQEILSHGSAFEVLSPQWFRDEIAQEAARLDRKYKSDKEGRE